MLKWGGAGGLKGRAFLGGSRPYGGGGVVTAGPSPMPPNACAPPAGREQSGAETGEGGYLRAFLQFFLLLCIQLDGEGRDIFFEMGDRTGAGNQNHLG